MAGSSRRTRSSPSSRCRCQSNGRFPLSRSNILPFPVEMILCCPCLDPRKPILARVCHRRCRRPRGIARGRRPSHHRANRLLPKTLGQACRLLRIPLCGVGAKQIHRSRIARSRAGGGQLPLRRRVGLNPKIRHGKRPGGGKAYVPIHYLITQCPSSQVKEHPLQARLFRFQMR
jgi:hypothetical protein